MKFEADFYRNRETCELARELIGKRLVVPAGETRVSGYIVETEAYLGPDDRAAHSYGNRRTKRTEVMFQRAGLAYVFFVYGMYHQFNVVSGETDQPHAILIRAIEPDEGIEKMIQRRGDMKAGNLTSGPGKLCIALGIDMSFYGADLSGKRVWIESGRDVASIDSGPRIGIDYAKEWTARPWRFWESGNEYVSK